jgi:hypothetical protein
MLASINNELLWWIRKKGLLQRVVCSLTISTNRFGSNFNLAKSLRTSPSLTRSFSTVVRKENLLNNAYFNMMVPTSSLCVLLNGGQLADNPLAEQLGDTNGLEEILKEFTMVEILANKEMCVRSRQAPIAT